VAHRCVGWRAQLGRGTGAGRADAWVMGTLAGRAGGGFGQGCWRRQGAGAPEEEQILQPREEAGEAGHDEGVQGSGEAAKPVGDLHCSAEAGETGCRKGLMI